MNLNRISIIGALGTGKTTLANELSKIYNIPATHIDGIHHLGNWQIRDKKERDKIILDIRKIIKYTDELPSVLSNNISFMDYYSF